MEKIGVILARLQPIHNGHLELIKKAQYENDQTYIFIGSADKFNKRNPIPISTRIELTKKAVIESLCGYKEEMTNDAIEEALHNLRLHIVPLDDLDDESNNSHEWGFYLYSKIVSETYNPNFTIYYSDGFEIITTWFPGFILRNNISLSLLARNSVKDGISATSVRKMIIEGDDENLKKSVPECVFNRREHLKTLIELSEKVH